MSETEPSDDSQEFDDPIEESETAEQSELDENVGDITHVQLEKPAEPVELEESHDLGAVDASEPEVSSETVLPESGLPELGQASEAAAAVRPMMEGRPSGIRRPDRDGYEVVDAMAGRTSPFGFGFDPITDAIVGVADQYLGDGSAFADSQQDDGESTLVRRLHDLLGESSSVPIDSVLLCPSADQAVEQAIQLARKFRPEKSFRTIAMLGSDHGRTGMCRTASGQPRLHEDLGPMMAGFGHVPVGDLDAVRAVVDDQTACILLSPIDFSHAATACDADYLVGLREICNERGILLIIDETQIGFGSLGKPFAFSALAQIHADIVVAASGLFGGLSGGLVLASHHVAGSSMVDVDRYPLLGAVAAETLRSMADQGLPESAAEPTRDFAVAMAEQLSGFEFIRDVNVLGMTIGIESDISSSDLVGTAAARGSRIEAAGDTAVYLQPPIMIRDEDRQVLLDRLVETMEATERATADLSL